MFPTPFTVEHSTQSANDGGGVVGAAVEAGVTAGGGDPDANVYEQSIREGLQLIAAATFDVALALIEN